MKVVNERYVIPSVERSFRVLEILAEEPEGISLADLSRMTEIPKSTLFRIMMTLQKCEAVTPPDGRQRFYLGKQLRVLGDHVES